nr:hypothetical protein JVH1_6838 [Rhodococcus sp. JVH1]
MKSGNRHGSVEPTADVTSPAIPNAAPRHSGAHADPVVTARTVEP